MQAYFFLFFNAYFLVHSIIYLFQILISLKKPLCSVINRELACVATAILAVEKCFMLKHSLPLYYTYGYSIYFILYYYTEV